MTGGAAGHDRALAWRQLLRVGNVFTAISNVIAGFLIVERDWQPSPALAALVASVACLYLAGMALNDYFDAPVDAVERPERPIPSGRISRRSAGQVGFGLLAVGVASACGAAWLTGRGAPVLVGCLLALAVVQYDSGLKTTWAGPIAMGWCRILAVLLGASIAPNLSEETAALMYSLTIGAYTIALTYVARSEADGDADRMIRVRKLVTWMIQGFIVLDAGVAAAAAGWLSGAAVLALLFPTRLLARRAPMT